MLRDRLTVIHVRKTCKASSAHGLWLLHYPHCSHYAVYCPCGFSQLPTSLAHGLFSVCPPSFRLLSFMWLKKTGVGDTKVEATCPSNGTALESRQTPGLVGVSLGWTPWSKLKVLAHSKDLPVCCLRTLHFTSDIPRHSLPC